LEYLEFETEVGESITLRLIRDGSEITLEAVVAAQP
jgi:hypothetical protein